MIHTIAAIKLETGRQVLEKKEEGGRLGERGGDLPGDEGLEICNEPVLEEVVPKPVMGRMQLPRAVYWKKKTFFGI